MRKWRDFYPFTQAGVGLDGVGGAGELNRVFVEWKFDREIVAHATACILTPLREASKGSAFIQS